jgi:predicted metal-dependent hydrolase
MGIFAPGRYNAPMQLELPFGPWRRRQPLPCEDWLRVGAGQVRLRLAPNRRARRYVLRLLPGGLARVTIPRGGSAAEARRFAERNVSWLERQLLRQAAQPVLPKSWLAGTEILFRGETVRLEPGGNGETGVICFGGETVRVKSPGTDVRPDVERHLWRLAARELPPRVLELAALHQLPVRRVTVRNQRSRWGSCSRRGTVSLNWRLVQTPPFVRDYLILHELAHLKEMNHSHRFWREVTAMCPAFRQAESWLKNHRELV